MTKDMKEIIAEAAKRLLTEKHVKKLTVKDIVEECRITRQTFYYHFEDIPEMLKWALEQETNRLMQEARKTKDEEERLRYFFRVAINAAPHLRKGMKNSYQDEIEQIFSQYIYRLFEMTIEAENLYQSCSRAELKLIIRYHSQAVIGLLRGWTEEDTGNLDQIVHQVYRLMTGDITPYS